MYDKLNLEYEYYKTHKEELKKKYNNQFVVLKDCAVLTSGDDKERLVREMLENGHKLGEFLVHLVSDDSDIVQRFYSRIV